MSHDEPRAGDVFVRCVDVHKAYRIGGEPVPALRGASLRIERPGFFAIMGQSGSGKSTLMHLLGALDKPDRGELYVGGRALHTLDERGATEFRRREIGIVFQQFNLIPTLTAVENVELPGMLAGEPESAMRSRSTELLERLGLGSRASHRPDALSGGEQQRVAIARALIHGPSLILADEPTGNLDNETAKIITQLLFDAVRKLKTTMILVTHDQELAELADRVVVLKDGQCEL